MVQSISNLQSAISEYVNEKNTPYAILLDGSWGAGKTYMYKKHIAPALGEENCIYLSLYGLNSISDIENEIFRALSKVSDNTGLIKDALNSVTLDSGDSSKFRGVGYVASLLLDKWKIHKVKNASSKSKLLCFDDLERWSGNLDVCMSYINKLVEHDGFKCLILCHSEKIKPKVFNKAKQKTIRYIYNISNHIQDPLAAAIDCAEFKTESSHTYIRDLINSNKTRLSSLLFDFNCKNIRIITESLCFLDKIHFNNKKLLSENKIKTIDLYCQILSFVIINSEFANNRKQLDILDKINIKSKSGLSIIKEFCGESYNDDKPSPLQHMLSTLIYTEEKGYYKGISSLVRNGVYHANDFEGCFANWGEEKNYEIYLDSFKFLGLDDEKAENIFSNVYSEMFTEKSIHAPFVLIRLLERFHLDIKRGYFDFNLDDLKSDFKQLINVLSENEKLTPTITHGFDNGFYSYPEIKDCYLELERLNGKNLKLHNDGQTSKFWDLLKDDDMRVEDINLEFNYHQEPIFLFCKSPQYVLSLLSSLPNYKIFAFSQWLRERASNPYNKTAISEESSNAKKISSLIIEEHSKARSITSLHLRTISEIISE